MRHSAHRHSAHGLSTTPAQLATAHAATLTDASITEADYAYIRAYLFTHGWAAAESIYGEPYVRAAMLPTE